MNWNVHAEKLSSSMAALGAKRIAILAFVGTLVFVIVAVSSVFLTRPQYEALYTGLDPQDVNNIGIALNEAQIPFDVSKDGKTVKVAFGKTSKARMLLAEKNLPRSAKAGYELFDNLGSLGLTSFMQEITLVRALEGEITRTVQQLRGVKAARVHIVMPKGRSFRRKTQTPTASVIIRTDASYSFSSAESIRHLVAAAIPGLTVDAVTVMNTDGSLLASGKNRDSAVPRQLMSLELGVSNQIKENIRTTLTPYLGAENFQISVAVRLDTDKRKTTQTIFDPASRVERSVREIKEKGSAENANTSSAVSVDQDIPETKTEAGPSQKNSENKERKEKLINYEVSSKTVTTVGMGYLIKNISIAAVINEAAFKNGAGKALSAEQMKVQRLEIEQLVSSAAGFDVSRGDKLKVTAVKFRTLADPLQPVASAGITEYLFRILPNFINGLVFLGVTGLVVFFGLRPATKALLLVGEQVESKQLERAQTPVSLDRVDEVPKLGNEGAAAQALKNQQAPVNLIEDVVGNVSETPVKRLEQMIEFDEEQAASVLKNWVHEESAA
ncbi:Flagellar M-ring protein FliF [hydrothermal vent metagenome]|uniref:Flagellar M-ring protein FliF n=1 Tax=hydrothermal vent metagenome TaxID=652676 RepID=A0A3B0RBY8_9ZZZZ